MRYYGYPVRKEIRRLPREGARKQFGLDPHRKVLAILGGSQGAAALNQWAQDNLEALGSRGIQLLCLTGPRAGDEGLVEIPAGERVARACFLAFSDDMAAVLSSADLVISRAGAGSIAEIIRCRTPALLIPYPYASDNHQLANARYVEQQGGAVVVPQRNLTNLREEVLDLIFNDALLDKFRKNLARSDHENRMETLLMDLERLAGEGTRFTKLTSAQVS
jgi:UDP-N-acetylglucosamine--N-acetylmuramyl-(pentapeptide) pyrophosphoryl-undecaprenol N-acetylglucosamine transferase